LEPIQKQQQYLGRRIKRGLFVLKEGILLNADVNGSLNIGRKAFGDEFISEFPGQ
jgi:transposase